MLQLVAPQASGFDRFWQAYPRRQSKKDARKAWDTINPSAALVETILTALTWQVKQPQWTKDDGAYVPYPASWLRAERWDDECPASLRSARLGERVREEPCERCGYPEPRYHSQTMCNQLWLEQQKNPARAETA